MIESAQDFDEAGRSMAAQAVIDRMDAHSPDCAIALNGRHACSCRNTDLRPARVVDDERRNDSEQRQEYRRR